MITGSPFSAVNQYRRLPHDIILEQSRHALLADLYVVSTGCHYKAAGHHMERSAAMADSHLLFYCLAGQGWFATGGRRWAVAQGTLVFAVRDEAHAYAADLADPWTLQWVHFDGRHAAEFIALAGVRPGEHLIAIGEQPHISLLFSEILNVLQSGYSLHHLITISASLRQLLSNIAFLNTFAPVVSGKGLHVEAVINFMLERLTTPLTLDDFADHACMSRAYFSRQFREKTGYAPMDYFIRLKIQKACELLDTTEMKVVEISRYLGYKDPYYFSRLFKRISGSSPSRYRQTTPR